MTLETENILERRRLRRKVGLWRGLAIIAVIGALGALSIYLNAGRELIGQPQIARVAIEGLITEDRNQLRLLKKLARSNDVKGVILFVNSPGGTTTGGEALYQGLRELAAKKPLVAQFGTVAASAAYIAGLGTDHIVARGNSITGSVGVIMQWPEVAELLAKVGVKMQEIKSGQLKATPSPFQRADDASLSVLREMIADGQQWFLGLVRDRRKLDPATIPGLVEGRVYSGRSALRHKLIDAIGGEQAAVKWLVETRKVDKGLKIVDWKPKTASEWPFAGALASFFADVAHRTFGQIGQKIGATVSQDNNIGNLGLDGLVSVWHPGKK